ncbi:MAG: hypothetical protein RL699_248 [Bacteroidota bacterium]|jgi:uncharacterized protein (DUF1800 family)
MASLQPYTALLGTTNARHLARRCSFCYTADLIRELALLSATEAVNLLCSAPQLVSELPYDPLPVGNPVGHFTATSIPSNSFSDQARKSALIAGWWWNNAVHSPTAHFKLTHFLSTCFTVEKSSSSFTASDFYDHLELLSFYAYGNYQQLAEKMTVNNAMLRYLNNDSNSKMAPNENYAREFLELFTIGKLDLQNNPNYQESDVVQAAKVLTGFKQQTNRQSLDADTGIPKGRNEFSEHDLSEKTFSAHFNNQTIAAAGNAGEMDNELQAFVAMVFNQQQTAITICAKLYRYFVKPTLSDEVIQDIILPLATELRENQFELLPTLKRLFSSQHFFDQDDQDSSDETLGGLIKSPLQLVSEWASLFPGTIPDIQTNPVEFYETFWINFAHNSFLKQANMLPFDPPNVAGHAAYYQSPNFDKSWISTATLAARFRLGSCLIEGENRLATNQNIAAQIPIVTLLHQGNLISTVEDPYVLCTELTQYLFGQIASRERILYFMNTFLLQGQPRGDWTALWSYYIEAGFTTVVELRLKSLLRALLQAPECQLC